VLQVLLLALSLLWTACGSDGGGVVPTYPVVRGEFRISVVESGELKAQNSIVLSAPRTRFGTVQIVSLVEEGSQVAEGDFVIQFDTTEPQKLVDDKTAELEISLADQRKMKTDQDSRMKDLGHALVNQEASLELQELRQERMRFEAEASRREVELEVTRARLAVEQAREKIDTQKIIDNEERRKLELKLQQLRNDLSAAIKDMDKLTLTAPAPGLVVYRENWSTDAKVQVGDNPWPGMPLIELPDLSRIVAATQINEVDVSKVAKDLDVIVTLDAFPEKSFTGHITDIATLATEKERRSSVKVFPVEAVLDQSDPIMKPGMTVKVEVVVERIPDVIHVPLESVFERGDGMICYVAANGSFAEREVTLGQRNDNFVVVQEGLEEGERVALRDPNLPLEAIGLPDNDRPDDSGGAPPPPSTEGRVVVVG
jgi:RND family efflux transporter MFP subunit